MNYKQRLKEVANRIYTFGVQQITIDLVQEEVEELLENNDPTPDEIGSLSYQIGILEEVFNPKFTKDIDLLNEMKAILDEWEKDRSFVNKSLGLDPNQ